MNLIITMFQYPFIQRALIVGVLVSLCAALLGVCLVLKHYSMIGDGLSHVSFGALSVAVALGVSPLWISIPIVIIASFCLLRIRENAHMKNDAAIAVVSSSALAIGITVTALTTGINTDVLLFWHCLFYFTAVFFLLHLMRIFQRHLAFLLAVLMHFCLFLQQ